MAGQIVLALFGSVALGAVLLLIGLRGKRLNRHAICALCRFDLEGTYPQSITCPECGAGLRRRKGVRIGARRKRWITLSAGVLLILLPAGLLGTVLYAVLTGADLNTYKPVGLLLWEGGRGNDATASAAAKELLTRVQNKQVSSETVRNIVEAALTVQANPEATWRTEWGDIIETAKVTGDIGNQEYQRFLEQGAVLEFFIRPRVRQGDPIPVEAKIKEARIGSGSQFTVTTNFTARSIDGQSARPATPASNWFATMMGATIPSMGDQTGYFHLSGAAGPWGGRMNYGQCHGTLAPNAALAPGPHTAEVTLKLDIQVPPLAGGVWIPLQGVRPTERAVRTAALSFVLTPPQEPTLRLVDPTPEQSAAFAAKVRPTTFQVQKIENGGSFGGSFKWGHLSFAPQGLPMDAAFTVKLRSGDSLSPPMGTVIFRAPDPNEPAPTGRFAMMAGHQTVSLQLPDSFDEKTVTIVLEPDRGEALKTVDLTEIYGQTLEIKDVEVTKVQW